MLTDSQFADLIAEYRLRLYHTCLGILRNEADAEDCVQEALLSAYKHREQFQGQSSPYTWMHRIAVNECLMWLRCRRRTEFQELTEEIPTDSGISSAEALTLYRLISTLSDLSRRAIEAQLYGLTVREIALLEVASESAIKTRLLRGRLDMMEALKR